MYLVLKVIYTQQKKPHSRTPADSKMRLNDYFTSANIGLAFVTCNVFAKKFQNCHNNGAYSKPLSETICLYLKDKKPETVK